MSSWGIPIKGFLGLKSKTYTFITNIMNLKKICINKNAVDDKLEYEDYHNALFNRSNMRHEMDRIKIKYQI